MLTVSFPVLILKRSIKSLGKSIHYYCLYLRQLTYQQFTNVCNEPSEKSFKAVQRIPSHLCERSLKILTDNIMKTGIDHIRV